MTPLLRPVTKMKYSMPASLASSTTCWMSGRSTTGSISFGMALVAGRKRVPRPATGKTALRIFFIARPLVHRVAHGVADFRDREGLGDDAVHERLDVVGAHALLRVARDHHDAQVRMQA